MNGTASNLAVIVDTVLLTNGSIFIITTCMSAKCILFLAASVRLSPQKLKNY